MLLIRGDDSSAASPSRPTRDAESSEEFRRLNSFSFAWLLVVHNRPECSKAKHLLRASYSSKLYTRHFNGPDRPTTRWRVRSWRGHLVSYLGHTSAYQIENDFLTFAGWILQFVGTSSPHTILCISRFHPRPHSPDYLLVRTNKSAPCAYFYLDRGHKHRWRVQCQQHPDGSIIRREGSCGEVRGINHLRFPPLASRPCPLSPCPLHILLPPGRRTTFRQFWPRPTEQALGQMA